MLDAHEPSGARYAVSAFRTPRALLRLALIGGVLFLGLVAFAWAGGWLSPGQLNQQRIVETFEAVSGVHPGFRRNHAKGVCLSGSFESNGAGARISRAAVFARGRVPVFGRFSLAGGMPRAADSPASVRSMALDFELPNGEAWRTGMIDIPVFIVRNPQEFNEQLASTKPDPQTGKPDPQAVADFFKRHPESARAAAIVKARPFSSGFANARYNALNTFDFIDAQGAVTPVRWSMVPEDAFVPEPAATPQGENYLFDELIARLRQGPARWHLLLTVGRPGDPTADPTMAWPADREQIDAGTLTVSAVQTEEAGNCRDINFDPLVLPDGIAPSDDPLLSARSATYSVSFTKRESERKSPSAIDVGKEP